MAQPLIKPETLKGFRDYLPTAALAREQLMETARRVYRSYGFTPIDTPALEYAEVLLGKGGEESDKQLFRFQDAGDRDVAMRFDLTVPFARFAAKHINEIGVPFRRYHIGTVWRGEKPQKGRYREFMQCDFDTIGTDSNIADIETLFVIHDLLVAIGFERFKIRVNNRRLLNGLLETLGLSERSGSILRSLDKLGKIGPAAVIAEMVAHGTEEGSAQRVLELATVTGTPEEVLRAVEPLVSGSAIGADGVARLRELFMAADLAGIPLSRLQLDVSIARGLDYYTGTIYETFLDDLPGIGSVCSGGRYDNLAGLFTNQPLPGIGASLGLDRLLAAMEELGMVRTSASPASVLVTVFDGTHAADYLRIGRQLRQAGLPVEVFPLVRPIGKQLQYADKKGIPVAVIAGGDEFQANQWRVKNLKSGEQLLVSEAELAATVRGQLGSG